MKQLFEMQKKAGALIWASWCISRYTSQIEKYFEEAAKQTDKKPKSRARWTKSSYLLLGGFPSQTKLNKHACARAFCHSSFSMHARDIESITQPLQSRQDLHKIQEEDLETFETGKRVIHLKPGYLVRFKDPIPLRDRRSAPRGLRYTTLKRLIQANHIGDLWSCVLIWQSRQQRVYGRWRSG